MPKSNESRRPVVNKADLSELSRRKFIVTLGVAASATLLAACGGGAAPASSVASAPASASAKPAVSAAAAASGAWYTSVKKASGSLKVAASHLNEILTTAQVALAKSQGFLKDVGIDPVQVFEYAGGGDTVRGVTSGDNPIGV